MSYYETDDEISEESDFDGCEEDYTEDISDEASPSGSQQSWRESDLDIIYAFPITVHREKYIVRYKDFEYY